MKASTAKPKTRTKTTKKLPAKKPSKKILLFVALASFGLIGVLSVHFTSALTPVTSTSRYALPSKIGSIGDSISTASNTLKSGPNSTLSWTTGTDGKVYSMKQRISKARGTSVSVVVAAKGGADSSALYSQAKTVISGNAGAATILMGGNDACAPTVGEMTSTSVFQSRVSSALSLLQSKNKKVVYASVPDLYHLWSIGKDSSAARTAWATYSICQNILGDPLSMTDADIARREAVKQRIVEYNTVIETECAKRSGCSYDNGAVHGAQFQLTDLSTLDYFHPNINGQNKVTEAVWPAFKAIYPNIFKTATASDPVVSIISPESGASITGVVYIQSTVTSSFSISKVEYYANGSTLLGKATLSSGKWTLKYDTTNTPAGTYDVTAKAFDSKGNVGHQTIQVTVAK